MARSNLVVGAHTLVYINGTAFGRVADLSWNSATPKRALQTIDTLIPMELVPLATALSGNLTIYRLHKDGGIEAAGMAATYADLTREKYFSIMVIDRVTDTVMFQADQCSTESQSWRNGKGYVMGSIAFKGLKFNNETQPVTQ